jgi:xanthine dehydrogenase accessory factor
VNASVYRSLKYELDNGKKAVVVTFLEDCANGLKSSRSKMILTEEQLYAHERIPFLDETTAKQAKLALEEGNLQYFQGSNGVEVLIEPYFPMPRLIVLGGGYIAKPLVEFGAKAGFLVTVFDDRPMFANKDRFPFAEKVICGSFDHCLTQIDLNEYSFVVIMTREHRHDLDCLKQVLNHKTAYTGMIGSKRSVDSVKKQLMNEGCPEELIDKINAPVGIEIGAVTPEEIAISIIAQVIRYRRFENISKDETALVKARWPELDQLVLEELCKDTREQKALVTIIETKGSVPRKAGTKMLVWSYGMTMGSIGGGYAEGEIINAAWQIIGSSKCTIHDIDITGQIAEEEGMVCGGIMRALIEDAVG